MRHTPRRQGEARHPTESRCTRVATMGQSLARPHGRLGRCCTNIQRGCHAVGLDKSGFIESAATQLATIFSHAITPSDPSSDVP